VCSEDCCCLLSTQVRKWMHSVTSWKLTLMERLLVIEGISFFSAVLVSNMFCSNKYLMSYVQDTCSNTCRSSCKVSIIYVWNILTDFSKISQYQISWKSVQRFLSFMNVEGQNNFNRNSAYLQRCIKKEKALVLGI
jgi:hypothetical protein